MIDRDLRHDRELLRAFTDRDDQRAFAELVLRHGPLVLGVCRRVLGDGPDADDAFQAAFLVLAKKAGAVGRPEAVANWLYGVALRCARRARVALAARRARERPLPEVAVAPSAEADWADVRPVLDEEIGRLPDKLRAALVLCELQGLERGEAAARLRVPAGTLSSRLARAKDALRQRLLRRGLALSATGIGVMLTQAGAAASAELPAGVAASIGEMAGARETSLDNGETWAMALTKVLAAALLVTVLLYGAGLMVAVHPVPAGDGKVERGPPDDKEWLQGEWKVVSAKMGEKDVAEEVVGKKWTITRDKLTARHESRYTLAQDETPPQIDVTPLEGPEREKGKVFRGVYKLEKGRLIIHFGGPDQDRPADFKFVEGARTVLVVLERVKK
jgi:RNA polymerase sigma factor (sigma-70 family)